MLDKKTINSLKGHVKEYSDFPAKGLIFRDLSSLLQHRFADLMRELVKLVDLDDTDCFAGIESHGFPLAGGLAAITGKNFIAIKNSAPFPGKIKSLAYRTEYHEGTLECQPFGDSDFGNRVCIVNDLVATGGSMNAAEKLLTQCDYMVTGKIVIYNLSLVAGDKSNIKSLWEY